MERVNQTINDCRLFSCSSDASMDDTSRFRSRTHERRAEHSTCPKPNCSVRPNGRSAPAAARARVSPALSLLFHALRRTAARPAPSRPVRRALSALFLCSRLAQTPRTPPLRTRKSASGAPCAAPALRPASRLHSRAPPPRLTCARAAAAARRPPPSRSLRPPPGRHSGERSGSRDAGSELASSGASCALAGVAHCSRPRSQLTLRRRSPPRTAAR